MIYQYIKIRLDFRLDWTNYRHQTKREILDKLWGNYEQILLQL